MTNDLRIMKKELKSFAKRVKDFKYTDSACITFLLTGLIMLSGISFNLYSDEIKTQQEAINTSIFKLQKDFRHARQENNKLLRNTNLELVQLMEQGDHVVKSPWGSFQFGSNYVYNDWKGTYKGRGDKREAVKYARENDKFRTYVGAKQGTTELKRVIEPISAVPVDAAVRPKDIYKTALSINLPKIGAPQKSDLNVHVEDPLEIPRVNIKDPNRIINVISPNARPFSAFSWGWRDVIRGTYIHQSSYGTIPNAHDSTFDDAITENININGGTYWTGVDPDTKKYANITKWSNATQFTASPLPTIPSNFPTSGLIPYFPDFYNSDFQNSNGLINSRHAAIATNYGGRWTNERPGGGTPGNVFYNSIYHIKGDSSKGSEAFHVVGDVHFSNVEVYLYGYAAFINAESFRGGITTMDNVRIKLLEDNNTVFNIQGPGYQNDVQDGYEGKKYATKFFGKANITVDSKGNTIYAVNNYSTGTEISNTGELVFNGASNIGFSFLTYVPDKSKFINTIVPNWSTTPGKTGEEGGIDAYKPWVRTSVDNPIKMYGDENVGIFFSKRAYNGNGNVNVGLHQGTFELYMTIGDQLNSSRDSEQLPAGQLKKDGYTSTTVDGNVGVFAKSGQRKGIEIVGTATENIIPTNPVIWDYTLNRLVSMAMKPGLTTQAIYSSDAIHDLEMEKFNITFGKYAKNGFMFLADNGTVIDIKNGSQTDFSDGVNGATTNQADTGTGTIVGYANGLWKTADTLLKSDSGHSLEGLPTEIKVAQNLTMVSDKGIAYYADNGGLINVNSATTTAKGYGSVIGYASGTGTSGTNTVKSTVNFSGAITADDSISSPLATKVTEKYTNIGAYAKNGGVVNVTGKATINGIGGFADNGEVNLLNTDNTIKTVKNAGLVAKNGGKVNFNGGTITIDNDASVTGTTNTNATPFYAKASGGTSGTIVFQNNPLKSNKYDTTIIKMFDGVVIADDPSTYSKTIDGTSRYQGLENVTVEINSNDVIMGVYDDNGKATRTWYNSADTGTSTFTDGLEGANQFGKITYANGATFYTVVLKNGKLDVQAPTVSLDNIGDKYNGIKMANELVTISNATTVSGNIAATNLKGQGLSMGNISKATQVAAGITPTNTTSGFINKGTINVTGGTTAVGIAGINVSYGTINNDKTGKVTVDNGAGLYATNGSKIVNDGTVTISGKGVGIAGLGTGQTKQDYGTDVADGTAVEIVNNGTLNVAGDEAIGIYAENNTGTARANVKIDNTSPITVGTKGVGIALVSTAPTTVSYGAEQGGTITLTPSGATDITTGVQGTGIYAEDSDVNLGSGDYVIETKEKGVGIFASGNIKVNGTLEYKYNGSSTGTGMGVVYDQDKVPTLTNYANVKLINSTNATGGMVGLYTTAAAGNKFVNNGNVEGKSTALEFGIVTNGADVENTGKITLGDATKQAEANVGIYAKAKNKITNGGTITVGNNAIGIYGYNVDNNGTIKAGDDGVAIYTQDEGTINLNGGSTVKVGENQAVGVYAVGTNQNLNANAGSTFNIGNDSFGFVDAGKGNIITSYANPATLGSDAIYAYQNDNTGKIINYTPLTSAGDRNYGIYGNGATENYGTIDFSNGNGNVGIYSTNGGVATNFGTIKVGPSNTSAKEYGVGMATGYYDETTNKISNEGTIINRGTIEVSKSNTMGMYAVGANSKAINYGTINLSGRDTIGMYLDRGAHGENWGTIQTTVSGLRGVKGIYLSNGSYIKNYGTINIAASDIKSAGIWSDMQSQENAKENASDKNPITGVNQTGTSTPLMKVVTADDMKEMGGVTIKVPPRMTPVTVTDAQGNVIPIVKVDTNVSTPNPVSVTVTSPSGITILDLAVNNMQKFPSASEATSLGMYVDTSGVNYTNPIQGLNNLVGLEDISLYFGSEASRYTTSKVIEIGDNILKPYNAALRGFVTAGTTLYVTSPSLTWMTQPTKDLSTGLLDKVYLVKVPYTAFVKDGDDQTYNFLVGLEKRYGVEGLGTQEKLIFDKISSLTGGEGHILAQAFDEMKGHQYSNIQQRTKETGDILSNEFSYLQNEWKNPTKNNSKIKAFGRRGEYKTDTAGVVDYTNNAYGVAYVYEKEGVTLGNKSGWYAGAVTNRYEFRDLGKSKEDQTMIKAGIFKTISPASDHNGSLTWTISGEAFAGINHMKRRYWIVDDAFEAKSNYATYGAALRNELGKDFRTSVRTSIRPYGALNLEYGRYTGIKEYGPVALEIKGNDYISVQPEAGVSFNYRQPVGARSSINASLAAAYTNELGEVNDVKNKAKLRGTDGPYYELRGDKENRKGSGKFDLNLGFENTRFGVTVNAGYDTKGENVRGGIGFRVIY